MKDTLDKIKDEVERRILPFLLGVMILLEIFGLIYPSIHSIQDEGGFNILFTLIILAMIKHIDERLSETLNEPHKDSTIKAKEFTEAMKKTINGKTIIKTLDVFAHSSQQYNSFIADSKIRVNKLCLLVCAPDVTQV